MRNRSGYSLPDYALYRYKWQYNGIAPFEEISDWCRNNLKGHTYIPYETIWFSNERDYHWFLLRWSS